MGLVLVVSLLASMGSSQAIQAQNQVSNNRTFEYAVLTISDAETFVFNEGESNIAPRALELRILYSRLGGTSRPTLSNLLNVIGSRGWELVSVDDQIWTFIRR